MPQRNAELTVITCPHCGAMHASKSCPRCATAKITPGIGTAVSGTVSNTAGKGDDSGKAPKCARTRENGLKRDSCGNSAAEAWRQNGLERDLQKLCETDLTARGIEYLHLSHRAREKKGWPDLTFAISGRPYAVELKGPVTPISASQLDCLSRLEKNGWNCAIVRSFAEWRGILPQES